MTRRVVLLVIAAVVLVGIATASRLAWGGDHAQAHGTLSAPEYALAMAAAKHEQQGVTGTFVGATAVATDGHVGGYDVGHSCPDTRLLHVRVVWKADADFFHGGVRGAAAADGPRKAAMLTIDAQTGKVCDGFARYRGVGAEPGETLLYGRWPARVSSR